MRMPKVFLGAFLVVSLFAANGAHAGDRWKWSLTPYLWATDISEDLRVDGDLVGGGDTEFDDLVDKIDTSFQLHFEGLRGHWGPFADIAYTDLSDSETGEMGLLRFDTEIEEIWVEAGALYRAGGRDGRLDLLFGTRVLSVDESYRLTLGELPERRLTIDDTYVDALLGARYHIPLSNRWLISLRGDASLGGTDYVWTAQGMLGWRFGAKRGSAVWLGYRYRDMQYTKGDSLEVRRAFSGAALALTIGF